MHWLCWWIKQLITLPILFAFFCRENAITFKLDTIRFYLNLFLLYGKYNKNLLLLSYITAVRECFLALSVSLSFFICISRSLYLTLYLSLSFCLSAGCFKDIVIIILHHNLRLLRSTPQNEYIFLHRWMLCGLSNSNYIVAMHQTRRTRSNEWTYSHLLLVR